MIVELAQEKNHFITTYIFSCNEKILLSATSPNNTETGVVNCFQNISLSLKTRERDPFTHRFKTLVSILNNDRVIGSIIEENEQCGLYINRYQSYLLTLHNEQIKFYEVGFGANGLYICFYKDNELCAIAEKDLSVAHFTSRYKLFIENEGDFDVISLSMLYYDILKNTNIFNKKAPLLRKHIFSSDVELQQKFNADFIHKIIALANSNSSSDSSVEALV